MRSGLRNALGMGPFQGYQTGSQVPSWDAGTKVPEKRAGGRSPARVWWVTPIGHCGAAGVLGHVGVLQSVPARRSNLETPSALSVGGGALATKKQNVAGDVYCIYYIPVPKRPPCG